MALPFQKKERQVVKPCGPKPAAIAIVGEAPGKEEMLAGRPFVGPAGRLLNRLLAQAGIDRYACYITNVYDRLPPKGVFKDIPKAELAQAYARLRQEMEKVRPHITLALGAEALRAITGYEKISDWRGSILRDLNWKAFGAVVPTYHPAAALREDILFYIILQDFLKARKLLHRRPIEPLLPEAVNYIPTRNAVAIDLEVADRRIISYAIASCRHYAFLGTEKNLNYLFEVIRDPKIVKVFHNAVFDIFVLKHFYDKDVVWPIFDTMLAFHLLFPQFPKELAFLASLYTPYNYYKHLAATDLGLYNILDAVVTYRVYRYLRRLLAKQPTLHSLYQTHILKLVRPVVYMQHTGVRLNQSAYEELRHSLEAQIEALQTELNSLSGWPVNANSPKQLQRLLYEQFGLPIQYSRQTRQVTVNEEALVKLSRIKNLRVLATVLELRKKKKLHGMLFAHQLADEDGRIRCSYNIAGTKTGRFSSSTTIWGTGTNLQNIPQELRTIFIPDASHCFLQFDLSQAEARIVAYLANAEQLIELFETPSFDIHSENALRIFGTVTPELRNLAKRLIHAANYGIGPITFANVAGISVQEAKRALQAYFACYPEIQRWQQSIIAKIKRDRTLETPLGRKMLFLGRFGDALWREAFSFIPQSTVADVLNIGLRRAYEKGFKICLQCHDSFVVQTSFANRHKVAKAVKQLMAVPLLINGRQCIIPTTVKWGRSWGEMNELD